MAKDPAALFYIDHWLVATREMRADCRGWYLNLVLHQFKSGDLPNDIEELANLAGVRISEFVLFQQVFQQVLKQKFEVLPTNRLRDLDAAEIIRSRELYKDKRAAAGRMSAFIKFIRKHLCQDENVIFYIKENVDPNKIETNDQHVLTQVFEQMFQLYINKNKDRNRVDVDIGGMGEKGEGGIQWNKMPGAELYDLIIPEIKVGCAQELMHLNGTEATDEQILILWKNFKIQHFTGRKYYADPEDVYNHFINWSKGQKVNGTHKSTSGDSAKVGTSQGQVRGLRKLRDSVLGSDQGD
jgi:hypothetical protein